MGSWRLPGSDPVMHQIWAMLMREPYYCLIVNHLPPVKDINSGKPFALSKRKFD
jgi:hypothetical protein